MENQKRIGIFGGTFDPVHFGHLNLAIQMLETHKLDEVWFCPARVNPLKIQDQPLSIDHRLKMLHLAIEKIPHCKVIDIEANREGPSYTVETLRHIIENEKNKKNPAQFCLILGDDTMPNFDQWREPEEIIKLVPIYVGRRSLENNAALKDSKLLEALLKGATATRFMEISSTEIRDRLARGLFCGHLVPAKVLDYIYANNLYCKT